jgi:hypothetical protein
MELGDDDFVDIEEDFFMFLFQDVLEYVFFWWFFVYIL